MHRVCTVHRVPMRLLETAKRVPVRQMPQRCRYRPVTEKALRPASAAAAAVPVAHRVVEPHPTAGAPLTSDRSMRQPVTVYLGLGANLGDARAALDLALQQLGQTPGMEVTARSAYYRTAPMDSSGPDYINAVVELSTVLTAPDLLNCLHAIEERAGRARPYRNAPRTLDLDILMYGEGRIASPALTIPHPRMGLRAFVLVPLAEIARQWVDTEQLNIVRDQAIERLQ
jgi:2-amino-4-hydroxy-6-hydroxymethyldihydropteridine diphosphokinase